MPVHVEQLDTEVMATSGELPWSREQIEMLVKIVLERLEQKERSDRERREETRLRPYALPAWHKE
jgi:hypothetical protein